MSACSFTLNMTVSKLVLMIFLFNIGFTEQVLIQCSNSFSTENDTNLCYYYKKTSSSWLDAYNQCLTRTVNGILIQIFSIEQFNSLKTANIDETSLIWLGANNFASFLDSHWRWLDGSIVDSSVIIWCPNSSYETAIGTYCAAYDSTLQCVDNYLCDTLFSAPCVSATNGINKQAKISLIARQSTGIYVCTSSFGGAYANWWTYSLLLLNWFILFCFFLYLCNRFILNKNTIILTLSIVILTFIMIIIYAILWGIQYNDIIQIPLAMVIIGCLASAFLLIVLLILLNDRTRVQRYMASMILIFFTIIVEFFLMLGLILCVAYCTGYITLASTDLDKDIIAALLASLIAAISILFYTGILQLLENTGHDRVHAIRPAANSNSIPLTTPQGIVPPRQTSHAAPSNTHRLTTMVPMRKHEPIDRATSPVDERILNEFYADHPKDVHQYSLEGRQYVVYEGNNLSDIESYRRDITQAMLLQEPVGLREAIDRARSSIHASSLADEIHQAQSLATKLV